MSSSVWFAVLAIVVSAGCTQPLPQHQTPVTREPAKLPDRAPAQDDAARDSDSQSPFDRDTSANSQTPGTAPTNTVTPSTNSGSQPGGQNPTSNNPTNGQNSSSANPGSGNTPPSGTSTQITYQTSIKAIFDQSCVSCHAPNASRAQSPLENYANAKKFGALSNEKVQSGQMPPGKPLNDEEKRIVKAWFDAGMPEASAASNNGTTTPTLPSDTELAGNWAGDRDEFSANWIIVDKFPGPAPSSSIAASPNPGASPGVGSVPGQPGSTPNATVVAYLTEIKPLLDRSCVSCHRPGGRRASSPMDTYANARRFASGMNGRIQNGTMPQAGPLAQSDKDLFAKWVQGGLLESKPANPNPVPGASRSPSAGPSPNPDSGNFVTDFRIKAGTGNGDWNAKETEVRVKVGSQFTIHNDDSVVHQWHTNGAPCSHGNPIQPGRSATCTVTAPYGGTPVLYDHNTNGKFYIRAER